MFIENNIIINNKNYISRNRLEGNWNRIQTDSSDSSKLMLHKNHIPGEYDRQKSMINTCKWQNIYKLALTFTFILQISASHLFHLLRV